MAGAFLSESPRDWRAGGRLVKMIDSQPAQVIGLLVDSA